jgi:hypothetical protein
VGNPEIVVRERDWRVHNGRVKNRALAVNRFLHVNAKAFAAAIPLALDIVREFAGAGSPIYVHAVLVAVPLITWFTKNESVTPPAGADAAEHVQA